MCKQHYSEIEYKLCITNKVDALAYNKIGKKSSEITVILSKLENRSFVGILDEIITLSLAETICHETAEILYNDYDKKLDAYGRVALCRLPWLYKNDSKWCCQCLNIAKTEFY